MSTDMAPQLAAQSTQASFFYPQNTLKCTGPASFRSQAARDAACLLDLDQAVISWSCLASRFYNNGSVHVPDFIVEREDGTYVLDIVGTAPIPQWLPAAVQTEGYKHTVWPACDLPAIRVQNCKDLLRYARYEVSLVDRILLLAALKEHGSMRLSEVINMAPGTRAISIIAAMILRGQIDVDLDEELIGPDSVIRPRQY